MIARFCNSLNEDLIWQSHLSSPVRRKEEEKEEWERPKPRPDCCESLGLGNDFIVSLMDTVLGADGLSWLENEWRNIHFTWRQAIHATQPSKVLNIEKNFMYFFPFAGFFSSSSLHSVEEVAQRTWCGDDDEDE